MIHKSVWRTG